MCTNYLSESIIMNIVIYNDELRSGMQMYLSLRNQHQVEIASDDEDLLVILEQSRFDITFLDLELLETRNDKFLEQLKSFPSLRVVGIYDQENHSMPEQAAKWGIKDLITRPIKHRELLEMVDQSTN